MLLGGILEFFLGNTFSFVVFCSFGGFWLTLGSTLTPAFNAYSAYAPPDPGSTTPGITSTGFHASFGFFLLFMGLLCFMYLICALRTNIVFVTIFLGLFLTFVVLTGSYWHLALGHTQTAARLQIVSSPRQRIQHGFCSKLTGWPVKAAGAFGFMACMAGWWIFFAQMLASVDFPFQIPVGDISHIIKGYSTRVQEREQFRA